MNYKTLLLLIAMIIAGIYCLRDVPSDKQVSAPETKSPVEQAKVNLPASTSKTENLPDYRTNNEDVDPVVLFFYTDWCSGCKRFKPTYNAIKHKVVGYRYVEINADKNDKLSRHFNIRRIPTVYIYDKKNNYKKEVNINNFENELRNYLNKRNK